MNKNGFTLLEMLIVVMILVLVGTIGSMIIYNGFRANIKERDLLNATWQSQIALQRMSDDIAEIGSRLKLNIASSSQFTFTSISGDTITYAQSGGFLQRTFNGVVKNLADNVTGLSFGYYDANNVLTSSANLVRCIKITATISQSNTSIQTISCPRNLL
jgi:prepilin-type N-terminal cleavage/methylation domain-containing protein